MRVSFSKIRKAQRNPLCAFCHILRLIFILIGTEIQHQRFARGIIIGASRRPIAGNAARPDPYGKKKSQVDI
jgi:hypothetical protein